MHYNRKLLQNDDTPSESIMSPSTSMLVTVSFIVACIFFAGLWAVGKYMLTIIRRRYERRTSPTSIASSSGVSPSTVKSLPLVAYTETETKQEEKPSVCSVCLFEFEQEENVKLIPHCGHMFHPHCIDEWLSSHSSCPICRSTQLLPLPSEKKKELSLRIVEKGETSAEGESRTNSLCSGQREDLVAENHGPALLM